MWKRISTVILPTIIAVALIAFMLSRVWDDLLVATQHVIPIYLIVAIILCTASWFLRGWRYQYIAQRVQSNISLYFSTACILVSQTANLIIPARLGDLLRMLFLKHEIGTPYTNGFTTIVTERVFDLITLAILGLCTFPFLMTIVPDWFMNLIFLILVLSVIFFIFLILSKRLHTENKILEKILEILDQLRSTSLTIPSLIRMIGSSIIIWITDILVCYMIALMFELDIPFMLVILAIVMGNLVKAFPITPGGIGTYELALGLTFEIGGVPTATATLVAVIDHLIKNLVTLAGGIISLYFFGDWAVSLIKHISREDKKKLKDTLNDKDRI